MKNNNSISFVGLLCFILFVNLNGQNFTPKQLINVPGKNTNFEIITHQYDDLAYICWENQSNSNYSIYLKKLCPQIQNTITIIQDTCELSNPTLTFLPNDDIQIVWQKYKNNHWQLFSRSLIQDSLAEITVITDSISNNIEPKIYYKKLAWIRDSSLVLSCQDSGWSNFEIIDTLNCSNPDIDASDNNRIYSITYEKLSNAQRLIKEVIYLWGNLFYNTHADSGINTNANYGWDLGLSYQKYEDNVWKVIIPGFNGTGWKSTNLTFNKENPNLFSFFILTGGNSKNVSNTFIAYDSDSLSNNKEIYIKLFPNWVYPNSNIINISNMPGDDVKPIATVIDDSVTIFWEHYSSVNSSEIWWAKDYFNPPDPTGITDKTPKQIILINNYPNPFNSTTNIEFTLKRSENVNVTIYNNRGKKIVELLNKFKKSGKHKVKWNGKNSFNQSVASGVYIYKISSGEFRQSKKLLFLK